jgi:hypothetical protein
LIRGGNKEAGFDVDVGVGGRDMDMGDGMSDGTSKSSFVTKSDDEIE